MDVIRIPTVPHPPATPLTRLVSSICAGLEKDGLVLLARNSAGMSAAAPVGHAAQAQLLDGEGDITYEAALNSERAHQIVRELVSLFLRPGAPAGT